LIKASGIVTRAGLSHRSSVQLERGQQADHQLYDPCFQPSGGRPIGDDEPEQGCPLRKHNFAFASCNQKTPNTGARIIITKSIRFWVC
jgi:hypothetical protein